MTDQDIEQVVAATGRLKIQPREQRWAHLSLCVLDAVYSINATYGSTLNVCRRYADHAGLVHRLHPADQPRPSGEQSLSEFAAHAAKLGPEAFAAQVLANRCRTSTRSGILKAEAAARYADIMIAHDLRLIDDVQEAFADPERLQAVEDDLAGVPGHGAHGVRLDYLWMLVGDDERIKPDRFVLRWLGRAVGRQPTPARATALVREAARRLGRTPWELDRAIWLSERSVTP
jgi:hypothetical protein